jgi:hypothetical protein
VRNVVGGAEEGRWAGADPTCGEHRGGAKRDRGCQSKTPSLANSRVSVTIQ